MKFSIRAQYLFLFLTFTQAILSSEITSLESELSESFSFQELLLLRMNIYKQAEALSYLRAVVSLNQNNEQARSEQAKVSLMLGNYTLGFSNYKFRWIHKPALSYKLYADQDISNKTILIKNQGFLINLMHYVRYLPLLKSQKTKVIVQVSPEYIQLFKHNTYIDSALSTNDALPAFDFQIPVSCLPEIFHTTLETIPFTSSYVNVDLGLINFWSTSFSHRLFKLGLYLEGSAPGYPWESYSHFPINFLNDLIKDKRIQAYSLRKKSSYNAEDFNFSLVNRYHQYYSTPYTNCREEHDYSERYKHGHLNTTDFSILEKLIFFTEEIDTKNAPSQDTPAILKILDLFITDNTTFAALAGSKHISYFQRWMIGFGYLTIVTLLGIHFLHYLDKKRLENGTRWQKKSYQTLPL